MPSAVVATQYLKDGDAWYRITGDTRDYLGPPSDDWLSDAEVQRAKAHYAAALARLDLPRGQLDASFSNEGRLLMPLPDQGNRRTCVSFALTAAMEGLLPQQHRVRLSRQYAHFAIMRQDNPGCVVWQVWMPRLIEGAVHLTAWPICTDADRGYPPNGECWSKDRESLSAEYAGRAVYRIKEWILLSGLSYCRDTDTPIDVDLLRRLIVKGYDIAVSIPHMLTADCSGECIYDVLRRTDGTVMLPDCDFSGHCLLIVGYGVQDATEYFVCLDSIGGRLIRVSAAFIQAYVRYGIVVTECDHPNASPPPSPQPA